MGGSVDAVILGGGDGESIVPGVAFKGLVEVAGRPMLEWVADAFVAADSVVDVVVVAPTDEGLDGLPPSVRVVVSDDTFVGNGLAGVDALSGERPVIVATGDIPAITPEGIDDFVAQAEQRGAELAYPLVRKEDVLEQFPGSERTFVPIEGGPITGGNLVLATPELLHRNAVLGQKMFETRKSVVQWALLIGPVFIARLAAGNLRPTDVENKMAKITGGSCAAIYTRYAAIGADVDKPWDVPVAEAAILGRLDGAPDA